MSTRQKILFLRPSLAHGGADIVTINLLNQLDSTKYDVSLALMHLNGETQHLLDRSIPIVNLNSNSLWLCIWPIMKALRKANYDVIYTTSGGMGIPMMIAAKLSNYKGITVVSERSSLRRFSSSKFKKHALLFFKRLMYKRASFVTTVSEGIGKEAEELLNVDGSKIRVVCNPIINDELFEKANESIDEKAFNEESFRVVAVGRFVALKDYPTLLRAFKKFRDQSKAGGLFILGKGPLQEQIWQYVVELGMENHVHFLGFKDNPYKYIKAANAFVLTSIFEGMPGVLIQSLGLGTFTISTDCPTGPNEIIMHEKSGYLVPIGDDEAIANYLEESYRETDTVARIREQASKSVDRFKTKPALDSYLSFLPN